MRTQFLDEEVLAKAAEAAEQERSKKTRKLSSARLNHRQVMRMLEQKRELEDLRNNLSDFDDYLQEEE